MLVVNRTRGTLLGVDIARADSVAARMRGLYPYRRLDMGDGVWLVPCNAIQTIGMKLVIDAIFLDREARVVRIYEGLRPGRFTWWIWRAHSTLELPSGVVRSSETQIGDLLEFTEAPAPTFARDGEAAPRASAGLDAVAGNPGDED